MVQPYFTFRFKSPEDVLEKLKRELDRYKRGDESQKDHAFNFTVTYNAMADWVWHCWVKDNQELRQKYLPVDKVNTGNEKTFFKARRDECVDLELCYVLGNSAKHVVPRNSLGLKKSIVSTTTQNVDGKEDDRITRQKFKVLTDDYEKIDAQKVFESTLKFWCSLISNHSDRIHKTS